jgi:precorrin isomerase
MNWYTFSLLILAAIIGFLLLIVAAQAKMIEHGYDMRRLLSEENALLRKSLAKAGEANARKALSESDRFIDAAIDAVNEGKVIKFPINKENQQ